VKLSIIVPTRNRKEMIAKTLPALLNQKVPAGEYEVVVVSDGSTDGTVEFLSTLNSPVSLRVIDRPHRGLAATRNAGIQAARGEIVLLIDDDMIGDPSLAEKHIAAHDGGRACVAIGALRTSPQSASSLATELVRTSHQAYHDQLVRQGPSRSRYRLWLAANFSAPRSLLLAHHGYDERFLSSEDHELAIRLWDAGVSFKFLPEALAYEIYSKDANRVVASDAPRTGAADANLARKHPGYRCVSVLASLFGESRVRQIAWEMCCVSPFSPDLILRIPYSVAEAFRRNARMERLGLRLVQYRKSIAMMRSAARETGSWRKLRQEFGMRLPVLNYLHAAPADRFEKHVRWLARRGYVGIAPSQWLRWIRMGEALPHRPVLISFQGACAEVAECALPVLRRYDFRAVVHVVTGSINGRSESECESQVGGRPLMTADQIRFWANEGIEFGSLSRSYRRLTELDAEGLVEEVEASAQELGQLLGRRPISFAYPYGAVNEAVLEQVRRCFEMALSDVPGLNALCTDPHLMRTARITPNYRILDLVRAVFLGSPRAPSLRRRAALSDSTLFAPLPGSLSGNVEI